MEKGLSICIALTELFSISQVGLFVIGHKIERAVFLTPTKIDNNGYA
jgi:hypothetical protein